MGNIDVCDICAKQSPDYQGLHISNHWYVFKKKWPKKAMGLELDKEIDVCEECASPLLEKL